MYAPPDTAEGYLQATRQFLLGKTASRWLEENQEKAFAIVEKGLTQAVEIQDLLQQLLDDAAHGQFPLRNVATPDGKTVEQEMSLLDFVKHISEVSATQAAVVDRVVSTRNKVASGGANLMASALLTSQHIQSQAARKERSINPSRRIGVDALKGIPVIEV